MEHVRIAKTEQLMNFSVVDESYSREIHAHLTLQESEHFLARLIFLGALGLVLNAVILWTTRYLDATLAELSNQCVPIAFRGRVFIWRGYLFVDCCFGPSWWP